MKLRTKVVLAVVATFLVMSFVIFFGSRVILENSYRKLENMVTTNQTKRAQQAIYQSINALSNIVKSGAVWDDMYYGIVDKGKRNGLIESAFSVASIRSNREDISLLYDRNSKLVDAIALSADRVVEVEFPKSLFSYLKTSSNLFPPSIKSEVKGLVYLPCLPNVETKKSITEKKNSTCISLPFDRSILLIAAHPVQSASGNMPSQGVLIQGEYFSKSLLSKINKNSKLALRVFSPYEINQDPKLKYIFSLLLNPKNVSFSERQKKRIFVYSLLKDINQQPFGMISITIPRAVFHMGAKAIRDFAVLYWIFTIASSIALLILLSFLVIRKLEKINKTIIDINHDNQSKIRLDERGSDELSSLSSAINKMLSTIEEYNFQRENLLKHIYLELEEINKVSGKLKEVEYFLEEIINSMPSIVIITNHQLLISHLNNLAEKSIDMRLPDVKNKYLFDLFPYLKSFSDKFYSSINAKKIQVVNKFSVELPDGIHFFHVVIYPFTLNAELFLVIRIDDISDIIKLEEIVLQNEKLASIGVLTAGISYEINHPINSIIGMIPSLKTEIDHLFSILDSYLKSNRFEIINDSENDFMILVEKINLLLNKIKGAANKTAQIVKDLKKFSRLDENLMKQADVLEGINSILSLLRHTYKDRINIILEYDEIPMIDCYPGKLNQVFMNLITNAIDAIPGTGEIKIKAYQKDNYIMIHFIDNGLGMNEMTKEKIFEPFFTTKETGHGMGLGLDICKHIVESHGGKIEVFSTEGKGSEFIVILPIA